MSVANPVNPVNPVKNTPPVAIRKSHVLETHEARIAPRPRQETFPRAGHFDLKTTTVSCVSRGEYDIMSA